MKWRRYFETGWLQWFEAIVIEGDFSGRVHLFHLDSKRPEFILHDVDVVFLLLLQDRQPAVVRDDAFQDLIEFRDAGRRQVKEMTCVLALDLFYQTLICLRKLHDFSRICPI